MATQPCPCGYAGDVKRECRCAPGQVQKYRARISGPLLDRIDLHVEVPAVDTSELRSDVEGEGSGPIRERVERAREVQRSRFGGDGQVGTNSEMTPRWMRRCCRLGGAASGLLEQAMDELNFSARAHDRVLKVARTLADLVGKDEIGEEEVLEAVQYRTLDRNLWA